MAVARKKQKVQSLKPPRARDLHCFERKARSAGFTRIAGIDEAGRGPLAGPVVAGACILPPSKQLRGIDDSKKLPRSARIALFEKITSDPDILYGVGIVDHLLVDELNIWNATLLAMQRAVDALSTSPDYLLVDGLHLPHRIPCLKIIRGDQQSISICAGAIVAKETRDRLMEEYHQQYPLYGFDQHKGYGTPQHQAALREHGPCPIHRRSFRLCYE
ncbi:MAG: ribonuclease HII [Verrucomicrobia bacterium]|nr:ribonuclease HII [Verrucomicrobiota bacterium]